MPLQSSLAAPGVLPTTPLFLETGVEPNLFFTLDNSNSMTIDSMMRQSRINGLIVDVNGQIDAGEPERKRTFDLRDLYFGRTFKFFPPANGTNADWDKYWVTRNAYANPMYYDPARTYLPWPGANSDGTRMYQDANPRSVKADPSSGQRYDLTATHTYSYDGDTTEIWVPTYFNWTDTDNDGIVDVTDEHERVEIAAGTDEMQNFANWYQYHRSRLQSAKYVAGSAIYNATQVRMGINMFNRNIFKEIASMQDPDNKRELLETLYGTGTSGETPALSALKRTGDYFSRPGASGPIFPRGQGGECQQNFNILMSDGAWDPEPSVRVRNTDGDANTAFDGGAYADNWSNTLADVAMEYYENDLRNDLPDRVPTQTGIDEAAHQHLVNYVISFGVYGELNPLTDEPTDPGFPGWPDPYAGDNSAKLAARADDLWHAAYNSRGEYYLADGAESLLDSFSNIVQNVSSRTASTSAVAINTSELKANSFVYQSRFNSRDWSGDLLAFEIVDLDSGRLADEPAWSAGELLTQRTANGRTEDREIITYDPAQAKGVPFTWNKIPDALKEDLNTDDWGNQDSNGAARLDYLRGDRSNEDRGLYLRKRASLLGDIVNSGPVYVGAPNLNWPDVAPFPEGANAYATFQANQANRKPAVYVGSNDGMLHGFWADDVSPGATSNGKEFFAYLPSMLASSARDEGLHYLTQPNFQHRFRIDLTPTVADAYITRGGRGGRDWRTVIIGALRGGGRGVFALDATSGSNLRENNAQNTTIWEFSDADDPDLGYSYSQPVVALTNAGTWVAIFGNGYNHTGDGKPHLFILNLDKGGDGAWIEGDDYIKLQGADGGPGNPNGLASPALVDVDGNGTVDRVYAGDLRGQLWAFDLSSANQSDWRIAHTNNGRNPQPLFIAHDRAKNPLTAKPVVVHHPSQPDSTDNAPNLMVYFGTGQFLVEDDLLDTDVQRFYGIWDKGDPLVSTGQLVEQSFDGSFTDAKVLTRNPVDYATQYGWFLELADSGERAITSPLARGDVVFFNSYIPANIPCALDGYGYRYAVDMATGGAPLRSPFDNNGDYEVNEADLATNSDGELGVVTTIRQDGFLPEPVVVEDLLYTGTEAIKIQKLADIPTGRLSWQELIQ